MASCVRLKEDTGIPIFLTGFLNIYLIIVTIHEAWDFVFGIAYFEDCFHLSLFFHVLMLDVYDIFV